MPRGAFACGFRELPFSWEHVFELKKHWNVSTTVVVARAHDLGLLGAVEHRDAKKHISSKGWTKKEPYERGSQQSFLFEEVLNGLSKEAPLAINPQIDKFCQELFFTPQTFRAVTGIEIPSKNNMESPQDNAKAFTLAAGPLSATQPECAAKPGLPYGFNSIDREAKGFFLLRGIENYELALHSGPRGWALGIERWDPEYVELPGLRTAERLWVVINRSDDREVNQRFVKSIAADKSIRERTRISTVNNISGMIALFQRVFRDAGRRMFFPDILEKWYRFEPIPLLTHTTKMAELIASPSPPESKPVSYGPFYGARWWER